MSKVNENNLQSALDYLYSQSEKTNMITIESGVKHLSQTYLGIAYLDPTDLTKKCTEANSVSTTGTKTGCMKWYIYKDLGNSYKMILDHNTTARIAWNSSNINVAYESSNIYPEVQALSTPVENGGSGWKVYEKDEQRTEKKISELTIISAEEVADIVGYSGFNPTNNAWFCFDEKITDTTNYCSKAQGTSNYAWLFDNLGWNNSNGTCVNYGCNYSDTTNSAAYWTKTPVDGTGSYVWYVLRYGILYYHDANRTDRGIRPVITVSKSLFNL